jgi:hypothetical protein
LNSGGNIAAISPRYTYEPDTFTAPVFTSTQGPTQAQSSFVPAVNLTGTGSWNWTTISTVNIFASSSVAHFLAFSTNLFSPNLVLSSSTIPPSGTGTNSNVDYTGGEGGGGNAGGNTGNQGNQGGCFTGNTMILLHDYTYKRIADIVTGDKLLGNNDIVTVLNVSSRSGTWQLANINDRGYFVTTNHPIFTENGWGAVDVQMLQSLQPQVYNAILNSNDNKPLCNITLGTNVSVINNGVPSGEVITTLTIKTHECEVYWLNVDGSNQYYANGLLVHNEDGK